MKITNLYPVGCGLAVVLASGSAPVDAGQPATTATRLLNPKGFINGGAIHLKPAASGPPPPTSIIVDTTLNPLTSGAIAGTPSGGGNLYTVGTNYGVTLGNNEFFSFSTFNVGTGDTAQFMAAGNVTNIISRVTGGPTSIYGTIISPTSFWFINPAGITIGPGATINVPAGLALATADYISFGDGSKFFALPSSGQTALSASSPASFGFLGTPASGALTVQSSTLGSTADGSINLTSGGPLTVQGTTISSGPVGSAPGDNGNITIQSLSSVSISDATVNSSGPTSGILNTKNGGLITIQGSSVFIVASTIEATFDVGANGLGAGFGQGAIVLQATGSAAPSGPDLNAAVAQPGELRIIGSTIDADAGNAQNSNNASPPPGVNWGDILLSADDVILNNTSVHAISSGEGRSGNITLNGNLGTWVTASSNITDTEGSQSFAGVISLNGGTLGTSVINSTLNAMNGDTQGSGVPNSVIISAPGGPVDLQGATIITSNVTVPEPEDGFSFSSPANGISISGQTIGVHGSTLTSQTVNAADAGNISLTAAGAGTNVIQIDGVSVLSSDATQGDTGIAHSTLISLPNAGTITVSAPSGGISISGGSSLSSSAGANAGQAGVITVSGTQVAIDDAKILTTAASTQPAGVQSVGGSQIVTAPWVPATISLTASTGSVSISGGTIINAETTGTIDAGSITIQAPAAAAGLVSISDAHLSSTSSGGTGNGGQISISGSGVLVAQQSVISSNYSNPGGNPGAPGSVAIFATGASAPNDPLSNNLTAATPGVVRIVDSAITATNTGGTGTNNSVTGFGQITIGGDFAGASGTVSDNVVIAGSVASTDVSAGGLGNDLTVEASNSVWIGSSPSGGFSKLPPGNSLGVDDIRNTANQSLISAQTEISAVSGGQILIQGGQGGVTIGSSFVDANNAVDGSNAGTIRSQSNITIDVASTSGAVALTQSAITTETSGVNLAGDIGVTGGSIQIGGGNLSASTTGSGAAGKITITASAADSSNGAALQVAGGAQITSDASQGQNGTNAGSVTLTATNGSVAIGVSADSLSAPNIISTSAGTNAGQAGIISITGQSLSLTDAKLLTTVDTPNTADGNNVPYVPASVLLTAGGAVTMTNTLIDARTGGAVDAGSVTILGDSVSITGGQQPLAFGGQALPTNTAIFTGTESDGTGGGTNITGVGRGGKITITASGSSMSLNDSSVSAQSAAVGNAGSVSLTSAGTLSITNGSAIQTKSDGGNSGAISIGGSGVLIDDSSVAADYNYGIIAADLNAPHGVPGTIAIQATGSNTSAAPQTLIGQVEPGVVQISNNSSVTSTNAGGFDPTGIGGSILIGAAPAAGTGIAVPTGAGTTTDAVVISGSAINNSTSAGGSSADLVVNGTQSVWIGGNSTISSTTGVSAFLPGQIFILAGGGLTLSQSTVDADNAFIGCLNSTCFSEPPTPANITVSSTSGAVNFSNATVSAQTTGVNPAGDIRISGQTVTIDGGKISTSTAGNSIPSESDGNAGNVSIVANGSGAAGAASLLVFGGAQISSDASQGVGGANAGTVILTANNGTVQVGSPADSLSAPNVISTSAGANAGQAGTIDLSGQQVALTDTQLLTTVATPNSAGLVPASVTLTAVGQVNMTDSLIDTRTSGGVAAGLVSITGNSVSIVGGEQPAPVVLAGGTKVPESNVAAFSVTTSGANAGEIDINASNGAFSITGSTDSGSGLIGTSYGAGTAGTINILANSVTAGIPSQTGYGDPISSKGVLIESAAQGNGAGGDVTIDAAGAVNLYGILLTTEALPSFGATVGGTAGNIGISGGTIGIYGSTVTTRTSGAGNAGNITLTASGADTSNGAALQVAASSTISSDANSGTSASAYAGTITLTASDPLGSVQIGAAGDAAQTKVSSSTGSSAGVAGTVTISAGKSITLGAADVETTAGSSSATGAPAKISLVVNNGTAPLTTGTGPITISNSKLNASTSGSQAGGEIDITGTQVVINNTQIFDATSGSANAGDINIAGSTINLANSGVTASTTGSGAAGDINIMAQASDKNGVPAFQVSGTTISSDASGGTGASANAGVISLIDYNGSAQVTNSTLSTSVGASAGSVGFIEIAGQNAIVSGDKLQAINDSAVQSQEGTSITILSTGQTSLTNDVLTTETFGSASAHLIEVLGSSVGIVNSQIEAQSSGSGAAGDILIRASGADTARGAALQVSGGSTISSAATSNTKPGGSAGEVALWATDPHGSVWIGLAGDTSQTTISSSTGSAAGGAGIVSITAGNGIALDNVNVSTTAGGTAPTLATSRPATITLSANNGSGPLSVANSTLDATTTGAQSAGQIDLLGSQIAISNSDMLSATTSTGAAGDITITGATVSILGGTGGSDKSGNSITVSTTGSGDAGNITISASAADPQSGSAMQIDRMNVESKAGLGTGSVGNAGTITIGAARGSVSLGDQTAGAALTQIQTSAASAAGAAGTIKITSAGALTARDTTIDTSVATTRLTDAHGATILPGTITLTAPGAVTLTNSTLTATTAGNVAAGDILVTSGGALDISSLAGGVRAGVSTSSTSTAGAAGAAGKITLAGTSITIDASDIAATIDGGNAASLPADITLNTSGAVMMTGAATIKADTLGGAPGGAVDVGTAAAPVASLTVNDGSVISVDASGKGTTAGHGGALAVISAGPVMLSGMGTTLSSNSSNDAVGGSIEITASSLSMDSGAQVTANTESSGIVSGSSIARSRGRADGSAARLKAPAAPLQVMTGGSVKVTTTGDVALTGPGTTISANASGAGSGGKVTITSGGLSLTNGASIATNASGTGNSGSITITLAPTAAAAGGLPPIVLSGGGKITTDANESRGGDITIDAGDRPLNMNNALINATAGQTGNGGNISISNLGRTILQNSAILAEAASGKGGAINLYLEKGALFVEDSQSLVSAQATSGNDGTVTINAPQTNFNAALATPDVSVKRTPELTSNACRRDRNRSTFVREGHGGVAPSPESYQTTAPPSRASSAPTAQIPPPEKSTSPDARALDAAAAQVGCE